MHKHIHLYINHYLHNNHDIHFHNHGDVVHSNKHCVRKPLTQYLVAQQVPDAYNRYSIDPASLAVGSSACASQYGAARPTPFFNSAGKPRCCGPIREWDANGNNIVAQCLK